MTREAIGAALLLIGGVIARLTFAGDHLSFVKSSLSVPLLLSALVLVVLGLLELRASVQEGRGDGAAGPEDDHGAGHDHAGSGADSSPVAMSDAVDPDVGDHAGHHHVGAGPRMGALLLAPLAVLMLVPAAPLGAFAADQGAANAVPDIKVFDELPDPAEDGAVEVVLPELTGRALIEPETVQDVPIRTIGFVVPDEQGGTYLLSRFTVGCCAVDAAPFQVRVRPGAAAVPAREQWVDVVLRFTGGVDEADGERIPVFELVDQQLIDEPDVPYVY